MDRALGRGRSDDNIVSFEKRFSSHYLHPSHHPPITLPQPSHSYPSHSLSPSHSLHPSHHHPITLSLHPFTSTPSPLPLSSAPPLSGTTLTRHKPCISSSTTRRKAWSVGLTPPLLPTRYAAHTVASPTPSEAGSPAGHAAL